MSRLALRFISGKHKGNEYLLPVEGRICIGRSSDIDLILIEDMVSRKHAYITVQGQNVKIEDLGSTNGTFVNGERISETMLHQGDRILIGTSIMKLVASDKDIKQTSVGAPMEKVMDTSVKRVTGYGSRSMTGTISEVPLPDLIQLFSTSKKTGTLVIRVGTVEGKLHLDQGRIIYATVSNAKGLKPLKAVFRILSWQDGTFELVGPEPHDFPETINMSTEHILMEGLRQIDEIRHMQRQLPPPETELAIAFPLLPKLSDLSQQELDVFQLVHNYRRVGDILDHAASTDLDVTNILFDLMDKGFIAKG
jgi:pSer/pThr/pTyr-binding forkhead associated (FHA) protein